MVKLLKNYYKPVLFSKNLKIQVRNKNLELSFDELMVPNLHFKRGKLFSGREETFLMEPNFDQRSEDPGLGLGLTKNKGMPFI